jgi:hypothetical protein
MAEGGAARPQFCSQCGAPVVVADASFCKDCGTPLGASGLLGGSSFNSSAVVAALLSVLPGLGHFYAGHPWHALKWFFGVLIAYAVSHGLGVLIHLVCAVSAARAGMEDAARRETARAGGAVMTGPGPR